MLCMSETAYFLLTTPIGASVYANMHAIAHKQNRKVDTNYFVGVSLACILMSKQREWKSPSGCSLNLYSILVGEAGYGKSVALNTAQAHQRTVMAETYANSFASAQAVRKVMSSRPSLVQIDDEHGRFLEGAADPTNSHQRNVFQTYLELWATPALLQGVDATTDNAQTSKTEDPRFSFLAGAVPLPLGRALKTPFIHDSGYLSRLTLFPASQPLEETPVKAHIPPSFRTTLWTTNDLNWEYVSGYWEFCTDFYRDQMLEAQRGSPAYQANARAAEQVIRVASLLALSQSRTFVRDSDMKMGVEVVGVSSSALIDVLSLSRATPNSLHDKYRRFQLALEDAYEKGHNQAHLVRTQDEWVEQLPDSSFNKMIYAFADYKIITITYTEGKHAKIKFDKGEFWGVNIVEFIVNGVLRSMKHEA